MKKKRRKLDGTALTAIVAFCFFMIQPFTGITLAGDSTVVLSVEGNAETKKLTLVRNFLINEFRIINNGMTVTADSITAGRECFTEKELQSLATAHNAENVISVCVRQTGTGYTSRMRLYSTGQKRIVKTGTQYSDADIIHLSSFTVPLMIKELTEPHSVNPDESQPHYRSEPPPPPEKTPIRPPDAKKVRHEDRRASVPADRSDSIDKLVKAFIAAKDPVEKVRLLTDIGEAHLKRNDSASAEKNYRAAVSIYEKKRKSADFNLATVARAYCRIGEISYRTFESIRLSASNEKEMRILVKRKTKALEEPAVYFAKAVGTGVPEWKYRATYMIGMGFVDMAEAVCNQTLFGTPTMKIAGKIRILASLDKYYEKARECFRKNIDQASGTDANDEYVGKSVDRFDELLYRRGFTIEQVGVEFAGAPVPAGLSKEEEAAYRELLDEKRHEAMDAALPKYEDGLQTARQLHLSRNRWLDSIRARITVINPTSSVLSIQSEPGADADGDGLTGDHDLCPQLAEDYDAFEDNDGCPDEDNDNDGVADTNDRCPNRAEDLDGFEDDDGCPDFDNDGDGIGDAEDRCPGIKGIPDLAGCPKTKEIPRGKLVLSGVGFQPDNAELTADSYAVLDRIAEALAEWTNVKLEIQGHTDNLGNDMTNLNLSQRRADRVKRYLVEKGIDEKRLRAVGYGAEFPVADNHTIEGRTRNRRVELRRID